MKYWPTYAAVLALAFLGGRLSRRPDVRTETKEVVKWASSERTAAATSVAAEKKQSVRVVTRWLRPDGTVSKEATREALGSSTSVTATERSDSRSIDASHASKSVTADARTYQPRLHVQGLLGLDLRAGLQRRWGVAASYRIVGPMTIGAWALPSARVGGASVGLTF